MKYARTTVPRRSWSEQPKKDEYGLFRLDPNQPVDLEQREEEKGHDYTPALPEEPKPEIPEPEVPKQEEQTPGPQKPTVPADTGSSTGGKEQPGGNGAGGYVPSDTVRQAYAMLEQLKNSQPGAYESRWQEQLDQLMAQILGRGDFQYDLNADALYQQYADQ